jgi:ketosteroid isomerase-like protein
MILALQSLLLVAFGAGLFRLWRAAAPPSPGLRWIVAAGFLARAAAGQALFWISWAHLPLLRSLQTGDGYWLFAQDAAFYFPEAAAFHGHGNTYIRILAVAIALLGRVTSVALLLNLFCYLGTIALLVRWKGAGLAIAAISLSPSLVLWSLQPLKDSLFQFLFVAFVAACALWRRAWPTRAVAGAMIAATLFLLAGIRWYVAAALVVAAALFLLLVAAAERKALSFAAAAAMIAAMALLARIPHSLLARIEQARRGFDETPATTMIRPGRLLAPAEPASPSQVAAADAAAIRALIAKETAAWNRYDVAAAMDAYWRSPQLEIVDGTTVIHGWAQAAAERGRGIRTIGNLRVTELSLAGAGNTALLRGRWAFTTLSGHPQVRAFEMTMRRFPDGQWKIVREELPLSPAGQSRPKRLVAGAAALVIPTLLGEHLGIFDIGGGRGLLWFADLDTLLFDAVLILALRALIAARAAAWRNPLAWLVVLATLMIAAPLIDSVSNFGTLFRLREMIYLGVALLPMAVGAEMTRDGRSVPAILGAGD